MAWKRVPESVLYRDVVRRVAEPGLRRALTKLNEDLTHPWTVDLLARLAGMSRSRFAQVFRSTAGPSVQQYVRNRRIRQAQQLLVNRGLSLSQVASAVGFRSESSFNRAFLSVTGQRPGRFQLQKKCTILRSGDSAWSR